MDPLTTGLVAALAAVLVAVPAGYGLARLQDRSRQSSARYRASEVTDHARREAENIIKDSELKAKDELFKKREEFNREIERARTEVRDQERRLEKREDVLDQKHQAQLKKERALEHAQQVGATICGVVGRDGGHTAKVAEACVIVPTIRPETVTPHAEAFQAVVWHLIVSHPSLQKAPMKWESTR